MITSVAHHFNHIASRYDSYKSPFNFYYRCLKQVLRKEIVKQKCRILDIGCGTGTILAYLSPYQGLGIDISSEMIRIAKDKHQNIRTLKFRCIDIEKHAVDGTFDYILCNDVIEHLTQHNKALHNIAKSMNRNSILILSMANPQWESLLKLLERLRCKMPEGPHNRISESRIVQLLNCNKLVVIRKTTYLPYTKFPVLKNFGLLYVYIIKKLL